MHAALQLAAAGREKLAAQGAAAEAASQLQQKLTMAQQEVNMLRNAAEIEGAARKELEVTVDEVCAHLICCWVCCSVFVDDLQEMCSGCAVCKYRCRYMLDAHIMLCLVASRRSSGSLGCQTQQLVVHSADFLRGVPCCVVLP